MEHNDSTDSQAAASDPPGGARSKSPAATKFGVFVRSSVSGFSWNSSMTPLCANESGTCLTQVLLCYALRSDVVSYLRGLISSQIEKIYRGTHAGMQSQSNGRVASRRWGRKRGPMLKDTVTILKLVTTIIEAVTTREALIYLPQTVVELAYTFEVSQLDFLLNFSPPSVEFTHLFAFYLSFLRKNTARRLAMHTSCTTSFCQFYPWYSLTPKCAALYPPNTMNFRRYLSGASVGGRSLRVL